MPLTTIDTAKDLAVTFQPLLLASFTWPDGTVRRVSTHEVTYGGNAYLARILDKDLGAFQALSESGIDYPSSVTLHLADADKLLWLNDEKVRGYKGATLQLTFVMHDVDTATFSTDSINKFRGICGPATIDEETLTVTASSAPNFQRKMLPSFPIQIRCPWFFPTTAADRQAGADNEDSIFFGCGYSPDAVGANARGNLNGAVPFTTCDFSKANCIARGMFIKDSALRVTGRFAGIQWTPPPGGRTREYVSGEWLDLKSNPSEAKYGDYAPLVYGQAWVDAIVMNVLPDGNSTRGEAIVCSGEVEDILAVVVNDVKLTPATDITGTTQYVLSRSEILLRWNVTNRGDRDGAPTNDAGFNDPAGNPQGDPYGSLCCIEWVVYRSVAEANQIPHVRVLVKGPKLRVYTGVSTFSRIYTANPAWVLLDLLVKGGYDYEDCDIQTFIDAAAVCDQLVTYTDQEGNSPSHARYSTSLVIRQRRSVADLLRAVRLGCAGLLVPNSINGKMQLIIKGTLAAQQSSLPAGSNYATAVTSQLANGTPTNGFVAYRFDYSTVVQGSLRQVSRPNSDTPNRVSFTFANAERDFAGDSVSIVDALDVQRTGQEIVQALQVDGVNSLDQAKRVAATILAEGLRGNPRNLSTPFTDTGGTLYFEFESTFRVVRLQVGQIVMLDWAQLGIVNQLFRVIRIAPTSNYERTKLTIAWHDDKWYLNSFGQAPDPAFSQTARNRLARPSFPWAPNKTNPATADALFDPTEAMFAIQQSYATAADGAPIPQLTVTGKIPVNSFSPALRSPLVATKATTASIGGTIKGGGRVYQIAVCAKDADGLYSAPSLVADVAVTAGVDINTISLTVFDWDVNAAGFAVFAGSDSSRLTFQTSGSGRPSSVTITAFNVASFGIPDVEFNNLAVRTKLIAHSGVFGAVVATVTTTTITITGAGTGWTGYVLSLLAKADLSTVPVANFAISANAVADVFTVTPNPVTLGIVAGDVLVMRSKTVVGSDAGGKFVEDAKWVNPLSGGGAGLTVDAEKGKLLRIIAGTGRGPTYRIKSNTATRIYIEGNWVVTPDSTSVCIVEDADWQEPKRTEAFDNLNDSAETTLVLDANNFKDQSVLVQALTEDGGGDASEQMLSPIREVFVIGGGNSFGAFDVSNAPLMKSLPATRGLFRYNQPTLKFQISTARDGSNNPIWVDLATAGGTGSGIALYQRTLTANITEAVPTDADGTIVVYLFLQGGAGSFTVTWNAAFKSVGSWQPDPAIGKYSILAFVKVSSSLLLPAWAGVKGMS